MKLYRLFLPQTYNDGKSIPNEIIFKITEKIRDRFGAYSLNPHATLPIIEGTWTSPTTKKRFTETMTLIEIFLEDTHKNKEWIKAFKIMIKQELDQEEIFLIVQDAEIY